MAMATPMTMTDRTEEFLGAVNVFRPTVTVVKNSSEAAAARAQSDLGYRTTSEFLQLASSVAVGFEGTSKLVCGVWTHGVMLVRVVMMVAVSFMRGEGEGTAVSFCYLLLRGRYFRLKPLPELRVVCVD